MAVSHNKLGDLHFLRGDLVQARCSYRDALDIRQRTFDVQSEGGAISLAFCMAGPGKQSVKSSSEAPVTWVWECVDFCMYGSNGS